LVDDLITFMSQRDDISDCVGDSPKV